MANQMNMGELIHKLRHRVMNAVKSSLVNDIPPGVSTLHENMPSIEALKSLAEAQPLSNLLPYEAYDDEQGFFYNRDTIGFILYAAPSTGLGAQSLRTLNGFFNQAHKTGTTIQISAIGDPNIEPILNRWSSTKEAAVDQALKDVFRLMAENRVNYLKKGKWDSLFSDQNFLLRNFHLLISYSVPIPKGMKSVDYSEDDLKELNSVRETTKATLRSAGITSSNIDPELFINLMNGILNPSYEQQPFLRYDPENLISKQILDADTAMLFDSGASTLIHKGRNFSVLPYHVRQFPQVWPGWKNGDLMGSFSNNILRLNCPFIATLTVNTFDQVSAKNKATQKSVRATQMADSPVSKYVPQWKDRKRDWEIAKAKLENGDKLLEAFYQVVLFAPEGQEQASEQALKAVYDTQGWVLSKSRYIPMHAFLGALPMGLCQETKRQLRMFNHFNSRLSWNCTNLSPWIAEWKGTSTPMMMFAGRRGQMMFFDPFDNKAGNYNMSCTATSGSGKSFFTQEWVFSCLGYGGRAFIIDAGHSYKNLCSILNGTYLEFAPGNNICLNPFSTIDDSQPEYFKEQLPLLKMLISQMASPDRPLNAKQKSVLEQAIMDVWKENGSQSTMTDIVNHLSDNDADNGPMYNTGQDLATMLRSYANGGMYSSYFEGEANIDLDNPFVVLELDALNTMKDLQSVVLLILMMRITQVMYLSGNKKQRKLCIIDEAWRLLGQGNSGAFIEEGYRVARKHGGSFMTITQKISDYFSSDTAKAAYANSDFKIYLRQDPAELAEAEAKEYIDNKSGKVDLIRSLETVQGKYSELAIDSPTGTAVCRFAVDPVTEKLYSTKADEVQFIRDAQKQGINIFDAINELVSQSQAR